MPEAAGASIVKLYVVSQSARSIEALRIVRSACDRSPREIELHVIDIRESPSEARDDRVVAVPTLITGAYRLVGELVEDSVLEVLQKS